MSPETWEWLHGQLKEIERTTWLALEMKKGGSHHVEKYKLEKTARNRLAELGLDDLDHLYSLRLGGTERIWGIRERNVLKVLWWDPDHKVCPSAKKHT